MSQGERSASVGESLHTVIYFVENHSTAPLPHTQPHTQGKLCMGFPTPFHTNTG